MAIQLLLVGINEIAAQELDTIVVNTLGDMVVTTRTNLRDYGKYSCDMYVCFVNREKEFVTRYGGEKVVALELRPPVTFFIEVARIPAGENVVLFNNSKSGADVLLKFLEKYGLAHVTYEVVAFEELSEELLKDKLARANYIMGNNGYVGAGQTLYSQYGHLLKSSARVIASPPREATPESISRLAHRVIMLAQKKDRQGLLKKQAYRINASVSQVAAAIEEMNAAHEELASTMQEVSDLSLQASKDVANTHKILQAIQRISSQTNLLGLNAAIEAARAGQTGRGFAVVAEEVRKLSVQSHDSTKDISKMLGQLRMSTENVIRNTGQTASAIQEQVQAIQSVTHMVNELQRISEEMLNSAQG